MVRKPEPPPAASVPPAHLLEPAVLEQFTVLFQKANRDYLYWDKFKHQELPAGVRPEDAWWLLQLTRRLNQRTTSIISDTGEAFWYSRTDELDRVLHVVDQQAGRAADTPVGTLPDRSRKRYLISSLMEEAIASSQMEGAVTTRKNAKDMLRAGRSPRNRSERMILNNYATILKIKEMVHEQLSPELILSLQESLTHGAIDNPHDSGRYRSAEDDIVVSAGAAHADDVLYVPPSADQIEDQLAQLCEYANSDKGSWEHPVIKAVILHFWLAYIHPFVDGNGRTARALFYLHMLQKGYWLFEYVSISKAIKGRAEQYYRSFLYSEIDHADLTYFLTFNLHAIERALAELREYIQRKSREDSDLQSWLAQEVSLNHRQRPLLLRALREPDSEFTIESHLKSHSVSYGTARTDLMDLVARGYLRQAKRGRAFVFRPVEDLAQRLMPKDE